MERTANFHFVFVLVLLSAALSAYAQPFVPCSFRGPGPSLQTPFPSCTFVADFIVASGGTGGLAAARALADAGYSVLVLEPGDYRDNDPNVWNSFNYQAVTGSYSSTYGVQLESSLEPVLDVTYKVLIARFWGGSNNHNGQMYVRPSIQLLNVLANIAGTSDWSVPSVQATFKEIENYTRSGPIDPLRGTAGSLNVRHPATGPTSGAGSLAYFLANATAFASGLPITPDYNGANNFGPFPRYDLFQNPGGNRSSTSTAYFPPSYFLPSGLTVNPNVNLRALFRATVVRVLYQGLQVVGVEYLLKGRTFHAYANREVVLAGSIFSAQILQQSGIGPASLLQSLGIPVVVNNPNVGVHVHNHPSVTVGINYDASLGPGLLPSDPWALYLGGAFFPSWSANGKVDPAQLQFPRKYQTLWLGPFFPGDSLHLYIIQTQPSSEGLVQIQSADPLQALLYRDNFYTNSSDLVDFANFLYYGVQNTIVPGLKALNPAFGITWTHWNSPQEAQAFVLANTSFNYHYVAANRLGQSPATSVVDPRARVWGVSGLRIADTSIFPVPVDGNTAATAAAVGRIVARMIIEDNCE
jgi:choline dehydrogenase